VISDYKLPQNPDPTAQPRGVMPFTVDEKAVKVGLPKSQNVVTTFWDNSDYYPYGMLIPERSWSSADYRYGYNTQEKSLEIDANGNHTTAEFWEYDARRAGRWNRDPKPIIGISEYATFLSNPIRWNDINGDEVVVEGGVKEGFEGPETPDAVNTKRTIEIMKKSEAGNKVMTDLENSKNVYTINNDKSKEGSVAQYDARTNEVNLNGLLNGITDFKNKEDIQALQAFSHELFHAYQDEMGNGDKVSISNEVEAYAFGAAVIIDVYSPWGKLNPKHSDNEKYNNLFNSFIEGQNYNNKNFIKLQKDFKKLSIYNQDGTYNNFPLGKKESQTLQYLFPIVPKK